MAPTGASGFSCRRASGLVRTLVVATATLAILLVCFSIYQYAQPERAPLPTRPAARLPAPLARPAGYGNKEDSTRASVRVGGANIGPSRNVTITFYARKGTQARFQIAVSSWMPVEGSVDEFLLMDPEIRLRTGDGNAVRVTAHKGLLEARRKPGGGLEPRRGRLTGDVLIEIDRLTEEDRAKLPEPRRGQPDPSELIQVAVDEIAFDLEYSKLTVAGSLHLWGHDVDLRARDLEVRFNEFNDIVETLTVARGGRIELIEASRDLGVIAAGLDTMPEQRLSLVDWVRATIQARLEAVNQAKTAPKEPSADREAVASTVSKTALAEGATPVFRTDDDDAKTPKPAVLYYARFEGNVDARQIVGQTIRSRMQADTLEILRRFSDADRRRVRSETATDRVQGDGSKPPARERIILEWTGPLVLRALAPDDELSNSESRSTVTATGSPARLTGLDGEATATRIKFDPDGSKVWLFGTETDPVVVTSKAEGVLTGRKVSMERAQDRMEIHVEGPGTITRDPSTPGLGPATAAGQSPQPSTVSFTERLDVQGRFVTTTKLDLTGGISIRQRRLLEQAIFVGRVQIREGETTVDADELTIRFGLQPFWRGGEQTIEHVQARGNVVMSRGTDSLAGHSIDIVMTTDRQGRVFPVTVTARGDVVARQADRTVTARDTLIIDFQTGAGSDVTAKRLRASGDVSVVDPTLALDLSAEELDCTVAEGRSIETALVTGSADREATVQLGAFSVTAGRIKLNASEESAEVPGAGRMTFLSPKDLDGRRRDKPVEIAVTWTDWMKYRGQDNRCVFSGGVHAASEDSTTFDCDRLVVEFEDVSPVAGIPPAAGVSPSPLEREASLDWWIFQGLADRLAQSRREQDRLQKVGDGFARQPSYLLATGNVVVLTSEMDTTTGKLRSRSSIRGPKLSLNLREDVSKMLIEGAGSLLLEDFRPPPTLRVDGDRTGGMSERTVSTPSQRPGMPALRLARSPSQERRDRAGAGLFGMGRGWGPSKTLIEWKDLMWYDFAIEQTRFEGGVELKHFSGAELQRVVRAKESVDLDVGPGRSTFLTCGVLIVDFRDHDGTDGPRRARRMGRLSAGRLWRFQASDGVTLEDSAEGLSLIADRVIYEKERSLMAVYGSPRRKARIVIQKPGKFPQDISAERFFYNLATRSIEAAAPVVRRR